MNPSLEILACEIGKSFIPGNVLRKAERAADQRELYVQARGPIPHWEEERFAQNLPALYRGVGYVTETLSTILGLSVLGAFLIDQPMYSISSLVGLGLSRQVYHIFQTLEKSSLEKKKKINKARLAQKEREKKYGTKQP